MGEYTYHQCPRCRHHLDFGSLSPFGISNPPRECPGCGMRFSENALRRAKSEQFFGGEVFASIFGLAGLGVLLLAGYGIYWVVGAISHLIQNR